MKKNLWILIITLIFAYLDGFITYFDLLNESALEINSIISFIHSKTGLDRWVLIHTIAASFLAFILYFLRNQNNKFIKTTRIIYAWFAVECFILGLHILRWLLWLTLEGAQ